MADEPLVHLWNGQWGFARLDIYVDRDGDLYRVRALQRQGAWGEDVWPGLTLEQAHRYVEQLLATAPGPPDGWPWRDIAGAHRRTR